MRRVHPGRMGLSSRACVLRPRLRWLPFAILAVVSSIHPAEAAAAADKPTRSRVFVGTKILPDGPLPLRSRYLPRTEVWNRVFQQPRAATPEPDTTAAHYARRYAVPLELARQILSTAHAEGIDPELGFRLIRVESRFKARARGPAGALGLMQLMPGTARSVDSSLRTESDVLEPRNNLRVGFRYLRKLIEMFDGDVRLGLLAYNRGEGTVQRALKRGADPENGYSRKVLGSSTESAYKGKGLMPRSER